MYTFTITLYQDLTLLFCNCISCELMVMSHLLPAILDATGHSKRITGAVLHFKRLYNILAFTFDYITSFSKG